LVVIVGAAICLSGIAGISYFIVFPEHWGDQSFWTWMPISAVAVGLGIVLIFSSLIFGLVSHFRRRKI
jgi:hypothetical protein